MIHKVDFAEPDHDPYYVNDDGEEVCPRCELRLAECPCDQTHDDDPEVLEEDET